MSLQEIIDGTVKDMNTIRESKMSDIVGRKCNRCKSPTEPENLIKPIWYVTDQDSKICLICHDILLEKRKRRGYRI